MSGERSRSAALILGVGTILTYTWIMNSVRTPSAQEPATTTPPPTQADPSATPSPSATPVVSPTMQLALPDEASVTARLSELVPSEYSPERVIVRMMDFGTVETLWNMRLSSESGPDASDPMWVIMLVDHHLTNLDVFRLMRIPYSDAPMEPQNAVVDGEGMYYVLKAIDGDLMMQGVISPIVAVPGVATVEAQP